jgi:mycothiol synthase
MTVLTLRSYQNLDDYYRVRAFLRQVMLLNEQRDRSWHVARLDYWRWHVVATCQDCPNIQDYTFLWESPSGEVAGVLNPEGLGEAFLQVHPAYRTPALEEEMVRLAEERLSVTREGERRLRVWADQADPLRQALLEERGYTRTDLVEHRRRRDLREPIPEAPPAQGYTVRSLGGCEELKSRVIASWYAFHPEPYEDKGDWDWYLNIQRAPLYRRDLDIVAEAPDGTIAGFCTVWYDDVTRSAMFEPVGVVPAHQRRGLGKAVMCEGLRRLRKLECQAALVSSYEPAAHALYESAGFTDVELSEAWVRRGF